MMLHRRPRFAPPSPRLASWGLLAALAFAAPGCRKAEAPPAPPPPTVGVVKSRKMDVPVEATATATTRALEEVTIRARVRGFLTERHFEEGSHVKKGDLLLVIDEIPYQIALQSAQARLAEAEASLKKAEQSRNREVSEARLALDQAQLFLAQIEERRSRNLLSRNAGTREDVDKTEADRRKAEAQVESDRASVEQAKSDYEVGILAARAQLDAARAAVRDAETNLGYCRMFAPIDGRIGEAKVKIGNLVGPEATGGGAFSDLCSIQQLDPMGIDIRVSSRFLQRTTALMKDGLTIEVTRPGLNGEEVVPEKAELYFVDNVIDQTSSTFLAKAKLPNPRMDLLPGEYVKLRTVIEQYKDAIVVPETAVKETEAGPTVYFVDSEGKAAIQSVEAGPTYEGIRVVVKGLDVGVPVIVEGLQLIRPGIPVKVEPANLPRAIGQGSTAARELGPTPAASAPDGGQATSKSAEKAITPAPDAVGNLRPEDSARPDVRPGGPRSAVDPNVDANRPADAPSNTPDATPKS